MNTITVSEAASKLGKSEGDLYGYQYLRTQGDAATPQRWWLYQGFTAEEVAHWTSLQGLRRIVPNN